MSGPTIIYVLGRGRSGSTYLENVLSKQTGITLLGESRLWPNEYRDGHDCSCGAAKTACPFWKPVMDSLPEAGASRAAFAKTIKRSFLASLLMPRALAARLFGGVWTHVPAFYRHVAEVHGDPIYLDSSKNPAFARLLASGLDVRIIHVVRHPLGVVYSWKRQRAKAGEAALYQVRKNLFVAALEWTASNLLASLTKAISPGRSMVVHYEEMADPQVISDLIGFCGAADGAGEAKSHAMAGNPGKSAREGDFRLDEEWRSALSPWEKLLYGAVTMPLYIFYPRRR